MVQYDAGEGEDDGDESADAVPHGGSARHGEDDCRSTTLGRARCASSHEGRWIKALYGDQNPAAASDVIEGRLVEIGLRALELGVAVVVDFGLWGRDERSAPGLDTWDEWRASRWPPSVA